MIKSFFTRLNWKQTSKHTGSKLEQERPAFALTSPDSVGRPLLTTSKRCSTQSPEPNHQKSSRLATKIEAMKKSIHSQLPSQNVANFCFYFFFCKHSKFNCFELYWNKRVYFRKANFWVHKAPFFPLQTTTILNWCTALVAAWGLGNREEKPQTGQQLQKINCDTDSVWSPNEEWKKERLKVFLCILWGTFIYFCSDGWQPVGSPCWFFSLIILKCFSLFFFCFLKVKQTEFN